MDKVNQHRYLAQQNVKTVKKSLVMSTPVQLKKAGVVILNDDSDVEPQKVENVLAEDMTFLKKSIRNLLRWRKSFERSLVDTKDNVFQSEAKTKTQLEKMKKKIAKLRIQVSELKKSQEAAERPESCRCTHNPNGELKSGIQHNKERSGVGRQSNYSKLRATEQLMFHLRPADETVMGLTSGTVCDIKYESETEDEDELKVFSPRKLIADDNGETLKLVKKVISSTERQHDRKSQIQSKAEREQSPVQSCQSGSDRSSGFHDSQSSTERRLSANMRKAGTPSKKSGSVESIQKDPTSELWRKNVSNKAKSDQAFPTSLKQVESDSSIENSHDLTQTDKQSRLGMKVAPEAGNVPKKSRDGVENGRTVTTVSPKVAIAGAGERLNGSSFKSASTNTLLENNQDCFKWRIPIISLTRLTVKSSKEQPIAKQDINSHPKFRGEQGNMKSRQAMDVSRKHVDRNRPPYRLSSDEDDTNSVKIIAPPSKKRKLDPVPLVTLDLSDDDPYECQVCAEACASDVELENHYKTCHPKLMT